MQQALCSEVKVPEMFLRLGLRCSGKFSSPFSLSIAMQEHFAPRTCSSASCYALLWTVPLAQCLFHYFADPKAQQFPFALSRRCASSTLPAPLLFSSLFGTFSDRETSLATCLLGLYYSCFALSAIAKSRT